MKIGIVQSHILWENKKSNIEKLNNIINRTYDKSIELLLLPEMSFTGFSMNTETTGEENQETIAKVKKISKANNLAIGFGWVKNKDSSENHYTVIDANGTLISDYVKIHPFSYSDEDVYFDSGDSLSFFELGGITFSTLICYDLRFPELFRVASKKADVIIVPANWPAKRNDHWETLLRARAIENQVYVIGVNCVGSIGKVKYVGNSQVIAPDGEVLLIIDGHDELVAIDLKNNVSDYRSAFPAYTDRKDELYIRLMENR